VAHRKRTREQEITPRERRNEVVAILSAALANMPPALSVAEGKAVSVPPPISPHDVGQKNSPESSRNCLEVSAKTRLSVTGD